jgi:hypothetical protein
LKKWQTLYCNTGLNGVESQFHSSFILQEALVYGNREIAR